MRFKLTHNGITTTHHTLGEALSLTKDSEHEWSIWDTIENRVVLFNE